MNAAEAIFMIARFWLIAGGLVAVVFLIIGIDRIDEDARGAYVFRPLLVPAVLLIWPLVLWRWYILETGRDNPLDRFHPVRRAHNVVAVVLAVAVVGIIGLGLSVRQPWPADAQPVKLSAQQEVSQ